MLDDKAIIRYFLYGETPDDVEFDFLHAEVISYRSRQHNWTIRPHSHPDHIQFLIVNEGGGTFEIEGKVHKLVPGSLVVAPAGMVHAFTFEHNTEGHVITAAISYIAAASEPDQRLDDVITKPRVHLLQPNALETEDINDAFQRLQREFVWSAPGRRTAIMAHLRRILVNLLRLSDNQNLQTTSLATGDYDLVLRYRKLLEKNFRQHKRLGFYVDTMAITLSKLNNACRVINGSTASKTLHDRVVIEAKRNLLYTSQSVYEVAHTLGFDDAAYFNRYFVARVGITPGAYRKSATVRKAV